MAKYRDILGNITECEDKTITISLERYETLIIKEAIADCLVEVKKKEKEDNKVVEHLKKLNKYNLNLADRMLDIQSNGLGRHFICLEDAVEIVKAGEVDGN